VQVVPAASIAPSAPSFAAGAMHTALKYAATTSSAMLTGAAEAALDGAADAADEAGAEADAAGADTDALADDDEPDEQALSPSTAVETRATDAAIFMVGVMREG